jgi:bifunctional DNA-binding transcriptional regulator/antitoxin component of YhaV-PrlF toxin-antitoxin module
MKVKQIENVMKKDVELRIHNKKYVDEGGYWNDYKGIFGKKKSKELLKESVIKIYDFAYYGIDSIKVDFDYKYWEKIAMFLTALYKKQFDNRNCTDWEKVYFEAQVLRLYLGDDYNLILDRLSELGKIELHKEISKFNKSKNCKYLILNRNFINIEGAVYVERNLISEKYQNSILNHFNKVQKERKGIEKYIETVLDKCTFSLNDRNALDSEIADDKFNKENQRLLNPYISDSDKANIVKKISNKDSFKRDHKNIMNRYYEGLMSKLNSNNIVKNFEYNINTQAFGNRISHIFSSMPKKYRKRLEIESKEVIEIDIVSSQVAFLLILLKKWFEADSDKRFYANSPFMMMDKLEMIYSKGSKIDLYKYMALKINGLNALQNKEVRNEMKTILMGLFYGSTKHEKYKGRDRKELIISLFGIDFFEVLEEIEKFDIDGIDTKKYRNLSALLQREESEFLSEVMHKLINDKILFLPLYDCLIVKKSDEKKVTDAFNYIVEKNGFTDIIRLD